MEKEFTCLWGILDPGSNPHFGMSLYYNSSHDLCIRFYGHKGYHYTETGAAVDRKGVSLSDLHGKPQKFFTQKELEYYGWDSK